MITRRAARERRCDHRPTLLDDAEQPADTMPAATASSKGSLSSSLSVLRTTRRSVRKSKGKHREEADDDKQQVRKFKGVNRATGDRRQKGGSIPKGTKRRRDPSTLAETTMTMTTTSTTTTTARSIRNNKNKIEANKKKSKRRKSFVPPFELYHNGTLNGDDEDGCNGEYDATLNFGATDGRKGVTKMIDARRQQNQQHSRSHRTFGEGFGAVVDLLRSCRNIVVLTGAGISVSCGIPDFRSQDTGLYSTLDVEELGLSCPEELFDFDFFQENPVPFFRFARNLYFPSSGGIIGCETSGGTTMDCNDGSTMAEANRIRPSDSHKLLALLEERKQLLRVYTQNIDGLELEAGVSSRRVVHAHGSLQWATCCKCGQRVSAEEIRPDILLGVVARCKVPVPTAAKAASSSRSRTSFSDPNAETVSTTASTRQGSSCSGRTKKTRFVEGAWLGHHEAVGMVSSPSSNSLGTRSVTTTSNRADVVISSSGRVCGGVLKPGVTFFGEPLRDNVSRALESDRKKADALIVIGTSLSVAPISKVIRYLPPNIPRILINRTIVHPPTMSEADNDQQQSEEIAPDFRRDYGFDAYLLGYCDDVTRALAKRLFATDQTMSAFPSQNAASCATMNEEREEEGKLLARCLDCEEDDENFIQREWSNTGLPSERVFLFPGALAPSGAGDNDEGATYREVAHCDGCCEPIFGTIRKCVTCFDFDLCQKCFPVMSKSHYNGKHQFTHDTASDHPVSVAEETTVGPISHEPQVATTNSCVFTREMH